MTLPDGAFNFWTSSNMQGLWQNLWWLVGQAAPLLEIMFAAVSVGLLITVVVGRIVTAASGDPDKNNVDDWED